MYFIGFTGGFPYLGGLPAELASVPRLPTPRQKVPQGAVGIAAGQTGQYTGGVVGRQRVAIVDEELGVSTITHGVLPICAHISLNLQDWS